jgi:hypothetical protein
VRIAFHAPRGSFLDSDVGGGDAVLTSSLVDALTARGHGVELVSHVDARDFYRGRLPARRLLTEALSIRRRMREFMPDAWLVYGPSVTYPDLFGWWLRPGRYVLYNAHRGKKERLPRRWRWLFVFAHRRSLARADEITVIRRASSIRLDRAARGLDDRGRGRPSRRAKRLDCGCSCLSTLRSSCAWRGSQSARSTGRRTW